MTIMMPEAPFIDREIALACDLPGVDAYSFTRACATSFQSTAGATYGPRYTPATDAVYGPSYPQQILINRGETR